MMNAFLRNTIPVLCLAVTALAQQPGMPGAPPPRPSNGPPNQQGDGPAREDRRPGEDRRRGGGGDRIDPNLLREAAAHDPKLLEDFVDRMLEQNKRVERRLMDAKTKLDEGAPPEEVFKSLREARAGNMAEQFFQNWRERQRDDAPPPGSMFEKPRMGPGGGLDPQQREELMVFIREIRPEFGAQLDEWQKNEPKAFRLVIGHLIMQAADTFHERDRDKQLYELRKDDLRASVLVIEKATELRRMQFEGKGQPETEQFLKAKAELRELMGAGYDARIRVREYEAAKLAKRLDETRTKIQETKDVREQMLDRAVQQLLERKRISPQPGDEPPKRPGEPGGRRTDSAPSAEQGPR